MKFIQTYILPLFLIVSLSGSLLSSCVGVDILHAGVELTIGEGEEWDLKMIIVVPPEQAGLIVDYLRQNYSGSNGKYNSVIEQMAANAEGNIPVQASIHGQGFDRLNEIMGGNTVVISGGSVSGRKNINFNWDMTSMVVAQSSEFTLHGGKIIQTNGNQLDSNTIRWVNPNGNMSAQMKEPFTNVIGWGLLGVGVVVLGLIIGKVLLNWYIPSKNLHTDPFPNMRHAPPIYQDPAAGYKEVRSKFCQYCGSKIPGEAIFCLQCGKRQP